MGNLGCKNPAILIFDAATSSLDSHLRAELQATIEAMRGKRTVVIITHRLVTANGRTSRSERNNCLVCTNEICYLFANR